MAEAIDSEHTSSAASAQGAFGPDQKAWRGWRAFVWEYLIVVVGVLSAAALGLALEGMRRDGEAAEAREALRIEMAQNAHNARIIIEGERCYQRILDVTIAWINGGPRPEIAATGHTARLKTSVWDIVKTGAVEYMPLKERLTYSNFYSQEVDQQWLSERERDLALASTQYARRTTLTQAQKEAFMDQLSELRPLSLFRIEMSKGVLQQAKAMAVAPEPLSDQERAALIQHCAQVGMTPSLW